MKKKKKKKKKKKIVKEKTERKENLQKMYISIYCQHRHRL